MRRSHGKVSWSICLSTWWLLCGEADSGKRAPDIRSAAAISIAYGSKVTLIRPYLSEAELSELKWLPPLRGIIEKLCDIWKIPLGIPIGWIEMESGGNNHELTSLGERGLFQIMPSESQDYGFDHEKISVDVNYSLHCGFRLMDRYRTAVHGVLVATRLDQEIVADSEYNWRLIKFAHSIGQGAARKILLRAAAANEAYDWRMFSVYCNDNNTSLTAMYKHSPAKWVGLVNDMFEVGRPFGVEKCAPPNPNT